MVEILPASIVFLTPKPRPPAPAKYSKANAISGASTEAGMLSRSKADCCCAPNASYSSIEAEMFGRSIENFAQTGELGLI
jgi:hypothetical protein